MTKGEEADVQDTEAGLQGGVQGTGVQAVEGWGGSRSGPVAGELGLFEQTVSNCVNAAERGQLKAPGAKDITPEQMEQTSLRAEDAWLRMECEIPKEATA